MGFFYAVLVVGCVLRLVILFGLLFVYSIYLGLDVVGLFVLDGGWTWLIWVVDDILIVDTFGLRVCVLYVVLIYRLRLCFGLGLVVSLVWCAVGRGFCWWWVVLYWLCRFIMVDAAV